ncbi:hypothetical protein NLG97_g8762 [Lecanicillium saksenae]|uniref:Uncharacterized protein n=1 Tax=Lecanicillium saksenae TaxID=468837 RepID=A0ACC1QKM5_9HYPO|nr:hypothetical protein NLG97_g8762 [Lecanicillium saksenae]
MATKGSCMCGETTYQFTGPVEATALCHCTDCQKWTGSAYTSNIVTPRDGFSVTKGTPKTYDAIGDSGKINKHFFCGNCGSSLYTELEIMPTAVCVKAPVSGGRVQRSDRRHRAIGWEEERWIARRDFCGRYTVSFEKENKRTDTQHYDEVEAAKPITAFLQADTMDRSVPIQQERPRSQMGIMQESQKAMRRDHAMLRCVHG